MYPTCLRLIIVITAALSLFYPGNFVHAKPIPLFDTKQKDFGWTLNLGKEFPGAQGRLETQHNPNEEPTVFLHGDFSKGGNYISSGTAFTSVAVGALEMRVKSPETDMFTLRVIDHGGVCHQIKYRIKKTDAWQTIHFPIKQFFDTMGSTASPDYIVKYEAWGGKGKTKNKRFSGKVKALHFVFSRNQGGDDNIGYLGLRNVRITPPQGKVAQRHLFNFEDKNPLNGWNITGNAAITTGNAAKGKHALELKRPQEEMNGKLKVLSAPLDVTPGKWRVTSVAKGNLHSPDNSFQGRIRLLLFDKNGNVIDRKEVQIITKEKQWTTKRFETDFPPGVAQARFELEQRKTFGSFMVDELGLQFISASMAALERVQTMKLMTHVVGNIFKPDDKPYISVEIEAKKPLAKTQMAIEYQVRDYWGGEQGEPQSAALKQSGKRKSLLLYTATLPLDAFRVDIGRYYEVHASLPKGSGGFWQDYVGVAKLPSAPAKQYKPEQIPFNVRSWDNRVPAYFDLADRLGIRIAGTWFRGSYKKPYNTKMGSFEKVEHFDMGISAGSPGAWIERKGFAQWTPTALAEAMQDYLNKYHDPNRYWQICLGNEPHGSGKKVLDNVKAYKILYETIKAHDPNIVVIGTSVNWNEEYFKAGFHNYLDKYDFHVYQAYDKVREGVKKYRDLAIKYGADKPIISTEIGLNSQGMPRLLVAGDVYKKGSVFFAEGGENFGWFGIQYPDPKGKGRGTSGEAHNVFDCKYSQYNPKMDAISLYNLINQMLIKKFAEEKRYDSIESHLFKDDKGNALQIMWNRSGRRDAFVPLAGVNAVTLRRTDGSISQLNAQGKGLDLTLSQEPILLSYSHTSASLAPSIAAPLVTVNPPSENVIKGTTAVVALVGNVSDVNLVAPVTWPVKQVKTATGCELHINVPENTTAREGRIWVNYGQGDIDVRLKLSSPIALSFDPGRAQDKPALIARLANHSSKAETVSLRAELIGETNMKRGNYAINNPDSPRAKFAIDVPTSIELPPKSTKRILIPLEGANEKALYIAKATLTDSRGNRQSQERWFGGFTHVKRSNSPITVDGNLNESAWQAATPRLLNTIEQYYVHRKAKDIPWKGIDDLSAVAKWTWDDNYLYLGVEVTDDVFIGGQPSSKLWRQDGIQLLVDPARHLNEKPGRYDYALGLGEDGPAAWCHFTIEGKNKAGLMPDWKVAVIPPKAKGEKVYYEVAIPWQRMAPFSPKPGNHFGLAMIINEDDGAGRKHWISDFSGVHAKQVDQVGDFILVD